jgi:Tfp pilus assembly protein PilN
MKAFNLLPDVKLEYLRTKRIQARVISLATIFTIAAISLVVLVAVWVYGGQTLQKSYLTGEIQKHHKELKAIPDLEKYLTIQNQLAHIDSLHEGKNDFSRLLQYLPFLNPAAPNNVTLTSIELISNDDGETLTFLGEAKDYTALNTFRDTLTNANLKYDKTTEKLFDAVTVNTSALEKSEKGGNVVVFTIDTVYNPNAFLSSVKNPSIDVSSMTTTQSVQASPNVFGKSTVEKEQQ